MGRAILLNVLPFLMWTSQAARIHMTMENSVHADQSPHVDCLCGQTHRSGTLKNGVPFEFTIGEGVDFKPGPSKCLTGCFVPETGKMSCNHWSNGTTYVKAARQAGKRKFCCEVKACTFVPAENHWVKKEEGQRQLLPLMDLSGVHAIPGNSCLCCTKKTSWGPAVNNQCKYAYGAGEDGIYSNDGIMTEAVKALATLGWSNSWWKEDCKTYCGQYPDHPVMLKTITAKRWTHLVADSLTEVEAKLTTAIQEASEMKEDVQLSVIEHIYHLLDDTLQEAETDTWSAHLDQEVVAAAKIWRDHIEAPYMNKKLQHAYDEALKAHGGNNCYPRGPVNCMDLKTTLMEIEPELVDGVLLADARSLADSIAG